MADQTPPQAVEGYGCSCGYQTDDKKKFTAHFLQAKRDDKANHKSLGRINLITGEITMPPWNQRSEAQIYETRYGKKRNESSAEGEPSNGKKEAATVKTTDVLGSATQIKLVPRVYTATFTPIMQSALYVAQRVWNWRENMPFENFLDTIIYNYYREHGVTLAGYIIETPEPTEPAGELSENDEETIEPSEDALDSEPLDDEPLEDESTEEPPARKTEPVLTGAKSKPDITDQLTKMLEEV